MLGSFSIAVLRSTFITSRICFLPLEKNLLHAFVGENMNSRLCVILFLMIPFPNKSTDFISHIAHSFVNGPGPRPRRRPGPAPETEDAVMLPP
jgi:hypothetical protein